MSVNKKTLTLTPTPFHQSYFHGTKADLQPGDLIETGVASNYGDGNKAKYVYAAATLDAAVWGAELAKGDGRERIYVVEATVPMQDDPNVTNKRFPGNPTMSYRSKHALRVIGEVIHWQGHSHEQIDAMKEGLAKLHAQGINAIED